MNMASLALSDANALLHQSALLGEVLPFLLWSLFDAHPLGHLCPRLLIGCDMILMG